MQKFTFSVKSVTTHYPSCLPKVGSHYSLLWLQNGEIQTVRNGSINLINQNTLTCLRSEELQDALKTVSGGYIFNFPVEFLARLQTEMIMTGDGLGVFNFLVPEKLCTTVTPEIQLLLGSLLREYESEKDICRNEMMTGLMRLLLLQMARDCEIDDVSLPYSLEDIRLVNRFIDLVKKNFMTLKRVSEYADLLHISPNYLNIKIKRISGFTASYHIHNAILEEAIGKARNEGMGLKQIAYHLGYEDVAYFSKFFKKATGKNFAKFKCLELN
ncbi:helix-turn-helix domain-containing protein [Flavobacterium sp.]|uniref:helix-turn-helix domain-containing protein n=1 Tax=Flavobacterium sp. TaxID=239 RepID=UPI0039E5A1C8